MNMFNEFETITASNTKESIMGLRVVGWGCGENEICGFCRNNRATIYVLDQEDGQTIASCNACTPPGSCPDPVADVFARLAAKLSAQPEVCH